MIYLFLSFLFCCVVLCLEPSSGNAEIDFPATDERVVIVADPGQIDVGVPFSTISGLVELC